MRQTVLELSGKAIAQLLKSRLEEGRQLTQDLLKNCDAIETHLEVIRQHAGSVVQEYYEKLRKRVDDLLANAS